MLGMPGDTSAGSGGIFELPLVARISGYLFVGYFLTRCLIYQNFMDEPV